MPLYSTEPVKDILLVFIGGGLGSVARFIFGKIIHQLWSVIFPVGILVVNILACLLLGIMVGLLDFRNAHNHWRMFVAVGFCGGFSTFSTFSNDTLLLFSTNRSAEGFFNIFFSVLLCLGASWLGIYLVKLISQ